MSMVPDVKTRRYVTCPNGCEHEFIVEHILSERIASAGPWYCDECGQGWAVGYREDSAHFEKWTRQHPVGDGTDDGIKRTQFVLLEIPPQQESIWLRVRGMRFTPKQDLDADMYFYEEHTCPTNWLGDVEEVWLGEMPDPHGLARVAAVSDAEIGPGEFN